MPFYVIYRENYSPQSALVIEADRLTQAAETWILRRLPEEEQINGLVLIAHTLEDSESTSCVNTVTLPPLASTRLQERLQVGP